MLTLGNWFYESHSKITKQPSFLLSASLPPFQNIKWPRIMSRWWRIRWNPNKYLPIKEVTKTVRIIKEAMVLIQNLQAIRFPQTKILIFKKNLIWKTSKSKFSKSCNLGHNPWGLTHFLITDYRKYSPWARPQTARWLQASMTHSPATPRSITKCHDFKQWKPSQTF